MRKPDSLAQMAQCEGAFSENPEAFRGCFLIVTGTGCRYRSHTDRDPGIRSEGGPPGSSRVSLLLSPEMPIQILLCKPRPDHGQGENTGQESGEAQGHVVEADIDEGMHIAGYDEKPCQ